LTENLSGKCLDEGVCIVCDRLTLRQSLVTKSWNTVKCNFSSEISEEELSNIEDSDDNENDNTILYAMKKSLILPPNESLAPTLISYYDCSDKIQEIKGILLSKKELIQASHHLCDVKENFLVFSDECIKHLLKVKMSSSYNLPPAHAIANHFFIGEMPDHIFCE